MIGFFNSCNIGDEVNRGWWAEGGGVGVEGGWEAEGGQHHPQGGKQQCCVLNTGHRNTTVNLVGRDSRQQQLDTPSRLISANQWPHRPCSGPLWFYRVDKRLPMKADLAIYSPINGVWIVLECGFHVKL